MIRIRRRELLALLLSTTAARSEIITPSPCSVANSITPCTGSGGGGPSPTVTSLTPNNGAGGTSVAIVGTNFTGATAVTFGSTAATSFTVNSATSITAVAPAGTGVVNVIVTVAGHSSAPGAGNQYTYPAPLPVVTSLTPNNGPSGTSVAVAGTGFTGVTAVAFGGTAATSFTFNSDTSITATAPAGSGTVNVTVTTPAGTSATGAGNQYTYPATGVTFDPAAKGASVTLSNGNLTMTNSTTSWSGARGTVNHASGKYYCEFTAGTVTAGTFNHLIGIANATWPHADGSYPGSDANSIGYANWSTGLYNGSGIPGGETYNPGDVVQMAVDITARLLWFRVNAGLWNNASGSNPATGTTGIDFATVNPVSGAIYPAAGVNGAALTANFGATAYAYTPPTGFGNW